MGRFGDGNEGSPLIIARHVTGILARPDAPDLKAIFIEQKYAAELQAHLSGYSGCEVIPGDYEQCVVRFLSGRLDRDCNYFF